MNKINSNIIKKLVETTPNLQHKVRNIRETKDGIYLKIDNEQDLVSVMWTLDNKGVHDFDYWISPSMGRKAVKRGSLKIIKEVA